MKYYTLISLLSIQFLISFSLHGMEPNYNVIVTTADQQEYTLPRWQVRESNTLYEAFLTQLTKKPDELPVCITMPTITYNELETYNTALNQSDFDKHYRKKLTPAQQRLLTIAVGQHARNEKDELITKLYDTAMSMKILSLIFDKAATINHMLPNIGDHQQLPVYHILDHFRRQEIIGKSSQEEYTFTDYSKECNICQGKDGGYYSVLPEPMCRGRRTNFNGFTPPIHYTFSDNTPWKLNNVCQINSPHAYILTLEEPDGIESPKNIQKLWLTDTHTEQKTLLKEICHTNKITKTIFSNGGKYLAISSDRTNKHAQLSLISLELDTDNKLKDTAETILSDHPGWIDALCFNSQGTILAAGIGFRVLFWDTQTHECLFSEFGNIYKNKKYLATQGEVMSLCFNSDDSRLAVITWDCDKADTRHQWHIFSLYDTSDLSHITLLNRVNLEDSSPDSMYFTEKSNKLLIGTDNRAFVMDGWTGEEIMKTDTVWYDYNTTEIHIIVPILLPPLNLLTTITSNSLGTCNVQLWDVSTKKLLKTLLENETDLCGIGSTPDNRDIFITYFNGKIMQTNICNENVYQAAINVLKNLDIFQLYCLQRIDREYIKPKSKVDIHRLSLLYKGIKSLPQNVKDVMYNIFHTLHAYGEKKSK